jgi:hypothetical protein
VSPILESIGSVKGFGWGALLASTAFQSIVSASPTTGTVVTFNDIPQNYSHLHLRVRTLITTAGGYLALRFNNSSDFTYTYHYFQANHGDSVFTGGSQGGVDNYSYIANGNVAGSTGFPFVGTIDIQDYSSTTRNKTARTLLGQPQNQGFDTTARFRFGSVSRTNTSAITSVSIEASSNFVTGTSIALYGIKGE